MGAWGGGSVGDVNGGSVTDVPEGADDEDSVGAIIAIDRGGGCGGVGGFGVPVSNAVEALVASAAEMISPTSSLSSLRKWMWTR